MVKRKEKRAKRKRVKKFKKFAKRQFWSIVKKLPGFIRIKLSDELWDWIIELIKNSL